MMNMSVCPCETLAGTGCQAQGPGEQVQQDIELPSNPAYAQYMVEGSLLDDNNCNPHRQHVKRHDPVTLTIMANQGVGQQQHQHHNQAQPYQQELEIQHQHQLELQQR